MKIKILTTWILLFISVTCFAKDYEVWLGEQNKPTELEAKQVDKVVRTLLAADVTDKVVVNINSLGGYNYLGNAVIDAMKVSNAEVVTRCVSQCLSNGAFILMAGDLILIKHEALIMFHISQTPCEKGTCAIGREYIKKYPQYKEAFDEDVRLFKMLDLHNFLTKDEWNKLLNGRNIWLTSEQMKEHFNRYFNRR